MQTPRGHTAEHGAAGWLLGVKEHKKSCQDRVSYLIAK
jgi:hypothetical protein